MTPTANDVAMSGSKEFGMVKSPNSRRSAKARRSSLSSRKKAEAKTSDDRQALAKFGRTEPTLTMLMGEPEIQLLMNADRVNVQNLMAELNTISVQLREKTLRATNMDVSSAKPRPTSNDTEYRAGVGIMLLNRKGQIFVAQRVDVNGDAWQMPQGGINRGELPRAAALRELREEIGTDDVDVIAESNEWFYYDVPAEIAKKGWDGKWRGQRQKWFVMIFNGQDSDIDLATEQPEFNAWRWVSPQELANLAVSFKRQLYVDLMGEFATIFRD